MYREPNPSRCPPTTPRHQDTPDPMSNTCSATNSASASSSSSSSSQVLESPTDSVRQYQHAGCDSIDEETPVKLPASSGQSQFDSLHDLLRRAGYKETRIVTPDRHNIANMAARQFVPPSSRIIADNPSAYDTPSKAAAHLRKAVQSKAGTPKGYSSKSLPSRTANTSFNASIVPDLPRPVPLSSWLSNLWSFGSGVSSSVSTPAGSDKQENEPLMQDIEPISQDSLVDVTVQEVTLVAPKVAVVKKAPSQNQVWTASVAYRSARSNTAPVRGKCGAVKAIASGSDEVAAAAEWSALQKGGATKKRTALVDAFSSPSKPGPIVPSDKSGRGAAQAEDSPTKQRKWRKDRAAWRESLGDLQAMMDQSKLRRDALACAHATSSIDEVVEPSATSASPNATPNAEDALQKLLSGPALPFLSTDPAVAPRNGACTKPAHLSVRRMKSVEELKKIMKERKSVTPARSSKDGNGSADLKSPQSSSSSQNSAACVNGAAGNISPSSRRSTPPRLTLSSPRGITSPKDIHLAGIEYEPWSPQAGAALISTRRLAKKSRSSRLRHTSSTSDLRQQSRDDKTEPAQVLSAPKQKSRATSSKSEQSREQVGSVVRSATGSLSRAKQMKALRRNPWALDDFTVFEDTSAEHSKHQNRSDTVPVDATRCKPLRGSSPLNGQSRDEDDEDDIFRCASPAASSTNHDGAPMLKKKDFSAKIIKTSKIMRLIEEAENIPSIANMISSSAAAVGSRDSPTLNRLGNRSIGASASRTMPLHRRRETEDPDENDEHAPLSSSLSKKSKDRMQTITRALGQRPQSTQPA